MTNDGRPTAYLGRRGLLLLAALAGSALAGIPAGEAGPGVSAKERARIELGRRLFFDPLVSRSGERSCASCHDPEHGFSDPGRVSEDDVGSTVRHSQTILDSHRNPSAHWDGEFASVEALVTARIGLPQGSATGLASHGAPLASGLGAGPGTGPVVPGTVAGLPTPDPAGGASGRGGGGRGGGGYGPPPSSPPRPPPSTPDAPPAGEDPVRPDPVTTPGAAPFDPKRLAELPRAQDVLEAGGRYANAFRAAFGSPAVTTARIARAVAAYCRSIQATTAPFDRHLAGDRSALSASARRGLALFRGEAGCARCHALAREGAEPPALTDFAFHNTGIAWLGLPEKARQHLSKTEERRVLDRGRERISRRGRDLRAFKTATLRDLTRRGPYMHTGAFETLDGVVRYYAAGGSGDPRQDKRLRGFTVTDAEVADLVAFLESLTGETRPGLAPVAWSLRPRRTRLRLVDAAGRALPGIPVRLLPVGDVLPGAGPRTDRRIDLVTDAEGWIDYAPPPRTHVRVSLGNGLVLSQGALVPDTCRVAWLRAPVRGRTTLVVRMPPARAAPGALSVEHLETLVLPGHRRPASRFTRGHVLRMGRAQVVRYTGWFRTDVPPRVVVRVPGERAHTERERTLVLRPGAVARLDLIP